MEKIIIIKGRERGRQAEGREKAKGGRQEATCYIPVYITQVCRKRGVELEGSWITGVRS